MDTNGVVFELSSDEDVGWGEKVGVDDGDDSCDWLREILDGVGKDSEDSDDVVLVGEVVVKPKPKLKNYNDVVNVLDDDDDDCVILDGDPDKPADVQDDLVESESDELQVVGEKGQVACRDYPHPRHLCAKYPFTSTPHESHCTQCHCYVCDSLAPCLQWGTGISSSDHCHASDKEEVWKHQREGLRNSHKATKPVPKAPLSSMSTGLTQINQVPVSTPINPYYVPQSQVPRPPPLRACTRSSIGIPGIRNQNRSQPSGYNIPINSSQPNLVSQLLHNTDKAVIPRDRRHVVGNLGPKVNTPPVFKRSGLPGVTLTSNQRYGLSVKKHGSQYTRDLHPASRPGDSNSLRRQNLPSQMNADTNTYRPYSRPNMQTNPSNFVDSQHQLSSQPNVTNILLNSVPPQPQVSSLPITNNAFVNPVTSQLQLSPQPYEGSMFLGPVSNQAQVSSQPITVSSFSNTMPSESQVYSQSNYVSHSYQNVFQQENETNLLDTTFTDIDLSWVPTSHTNQHPQAENSQLQAVGLNDESSPVTGIDSLFGQSTNPTSLDFQNDNFWALENHDAPVSSPEPGLSSFFFGL